MTGVCLPLVGGYKILISNPIWHFNYITIKQQISCKLLTFCYSDMIGIYFNTVSTTPIAIIRIYNLLYSFETVSVKQCRLLNRRPIISHCRVPCMPVYFKRKTSPINLQRMWQVNTSEPQQRFLWNMNW